MKESNPFLGRLIDALMPYSWVIVIVISLVSAMAAPRAFGLLKNISTDLATLLPDSYPSVHYSNEIKNKFKKKSGGDLIVILSSENADRNLKALQSLNDFVLTQPLVDKTGITKSDYSFIDQHKLLYVDLNDLEKVKDRLQRKIRQEKLGGLYVDLEGEENQDGKDPLNFDDLFSKYRAEYIRSVKSPYYTNEKGTVYAFWIYPKSTDTALKTYENFYREINGQVAPYMKQNFPDVNLAYAGSIKTRLDEYESLMSDLQTAGLISTIGILILLVIYYRSIMAVILIFVPLMAGIIDGFAIASLFISNLNVVTSFLFSILLGLGVDIGIHMSTRYYTDRLAGHDLRQAIHNILLRTGRSSSVGVLTTVLTFFVLVINDFRGFSEFGWIAGIGLSVTLIIYLVYFPALLVLAEKIKFFKPYRIHPRLLSRNFSVGDRFPWAKKVTVSCFVFSMICLGLFWFVRFEWNYSVLKINLPETVVAKAKLKEVNQRVNSPAMVLLQGRDEALAIKKAIEEKRESLGPNSVVERFNSSYDLVPENQKEKLAKLKEIDALLADDALNVVKGEDKQLINDFRNDIKRTQLINPKDVPETMKKLFFASPPYENQQVGFVYPLKNLEFDDGRNALKFFNEIHQIHTPEKTFYAVSDSLVFANVLSTMFHDSRTAIILSVLILLVLVYFDFKNFQKTVIVVLGLSFGVMSMIGLAVMFGWKFNFYNMITIPIVIGMGEDNSIQIIHRFEELGEKTVMKALSTSGSSALLASLTSVLGFTGLIFAHHPGLKSIGIFAVVGIMACMIGSLIFLPAMLQWLKDSKHLSKST